jgi:hypothetical protein
LLSYFLQILLSIFGLHKGEPAMKHQALPSHPILLLFKCCHSCGFTTTINHPLLWHSWMLGFGFTTPWNDLGDIHDSWGKIKKQLQLGFPIGLEKKTAGEAITQTIKPKIP